MTIKRTKRYIERRGGTFYRNRHGYWVAEFVLPGILPRLEVLRADTLAGLHSLVKKSIRT